MANLKSKSTPRKLSSKDFEKGSPERLNRPIDTLQTPKEAIQAKNTPKTEEIADNERIRLKSIDLVAAKLPVVFTSKRHISRQIDTPEYETGIKVAIYDNLNQVKLTVFDMSKPPMKGGIRDGRSNNSSFDKRGRSRVKRAMDAFSMPRKGRHRKKHPKGVNLITLTFGKNLPDEYEARKLVGYFLKALKDYIERPSNRSGRRKQRFQYLWVLEVQTERLETTGELAFHFHIVTPNYIQGQSYTKKSGEVIVQYQDGNDVVNRLWNKVVFNHFKDETDVLFPNRQFVSFRVKDYLIKNSDGEVVTTLIGNKQQQLTKYLTKGNKGIPIYGSLYSMDSFTSEFIKPDIKAVFCSIPNKTIKDLKPVFNKGCVYEDWVGNPIVKAFRVGLDERRDFEKVLIKSNFRFNSDSWIFNLPKTDSIELEICSKPVAITVCSPESMGEGVQKDKEQVL